MKTRKLLAFFVCIIAVMLLLATTASAKEIFVSSTGNDSANGLFETLPVKTLSRAYMLLGTKGGDITLLNDMAYSPASSSVGAVNIKGKTATVKLTLPSSVSLNGDTTFKNLTLSGASTIYASGKKLVIDSDVTSDSRLTVYGGLNGAALTGNTYIELLGGQYSTVYGGGYAGSVSGDTTVIFGGNANPSDQPTDNGSSCKVYGGSNNAVVSGKANVYLRGNAVTQYVVGAGSGTNGRVKNINVYIEGGKAMNVYGGSLGTALDAGTQINVTMTGGAVEAIFGACNGTSMTGDVTVTLLGGEVTRRVYSGCYNNADNKIFKYEYTTSYYVNGTTLLVIGPDARLVTGSDLNRGIFAGSRIAKQNASENNTLAFINGSYSAHGSKIGEKGGLYTSYFKSFANYTVKLGSGGTVETAKTAGKLVIKPNEGYIGKIGSSYYDNEAASLSSTTEVTFVKKVVEENGKITFNAPGIKKDLATIEDVSDGKILKGWQKNGTYVDLSSGTEITSAAGDVYTAVYETYTLGNENSDMYTAGAQIRSTQSGTKTRYDLRFISQFKKSFLANELFGITEFGGEGVKYGHVVVPVGEKYLGENELIEADKATSTGVMPKTVAAVKTYSTEGDTVQFTVCITKIASANYDRCYAVRPYVMYTDKNGRAKIIYGEQYQTASINSVLGAQ